MNNETTVATRPDEHIQNPDKIDMNRMQGDFDERVSRTKYIVTQLAQRLHEVKRDTYTELDKIQGKNSNRTNSNSYSKSPNSMEGRRNANLSSRGHSKS